MLETRSRDGRSEAAPETTGHHRSRLRGPEELPESGRNSESGHRSVQPTEVRETRAELPAPEGGGCGSCGQDGCGGKGAGDCGALD